MANKISSATKVVIPCRISFANIFEAIITIGARPTVLNCKRKMNKI